MTATIAVMQDMLKQQLAPTLQDQIDWQDVLLEDSLNLDGQNRTGVTIDFKNNKFEIASLKSGMTAYAGGEGGAIIASDIGLDKMETVPKFTTASYRIGHEAIQVTLSSEAALKQGVAMYDMEIRRAMLRAKGRFLRGNGQGIIGVLPAGVQAAAAITISARAPGTTASQNRYGLGALDMFQEGAVLQMGTAADFAGGTTVEGTILSIDSDTQITFTASVTVGAAAGANNRGGTNADTWYIRNKGEYGNAPMGLLGLVDDGTLEPGITTIQNKTRSTTPYMKSVVLDKANASTIIKDFRDLYSGFTRYNKKPKFFLVSEDVYGKYTDSITITVNASQATGDYKSKLGTGHTGLAFAYGSTPIPIMMDQALPSGTVLLLDTDFLFTADLFADAYIEDAVLTRVSGSKLYETVRAAYYNFGTYGARKLGARINYQAV